MTKRIDLPVYRSAFIGRERDLAQLRAGVDEGRCLTTLFGPPGVGKTRLAVQHASEMAHRGMAIRFCDLTHAEGLRGLLDAIVRSLGLHESHGGSDEQRVAQIGAVLARFGRLLLVLDNLDSLTEVAVSPLASWCATAQNVQFLVTSREAIGIDAEHVMPVEPLEVPRRDARAEEVLRSEAVRLFMACATGPVDLPADLPWIARSVRRLDGIPLAIELAAARTEVLSVRALDARLSERFALLRRPSGGGATRAPRHGTLWSALDASWRQLAPEEREALAQMSVFSGSFSLEAAEAVIDLSSPSCSGRTVLDAVHGLLRKSLLRPFGARGHARESRFVLLESIREYAARRLPSGGLDQPGSYESVARRHADYYLVRGEAWANRVGTRESFEGLACLQADFENLAAVLRRAVAVRPASAEPACQALRAVLALGPLLSTRGSTTEHVALLDAAIAAAEEVPEVLRTRPFVRALQARCQAYRFQNRFAESEADTRRALATARALGATDLEAISLGDLGAVAMLQRQFDEAAARFDEALAKHHATGDVRQQGIVLSRKGLLYSRLERRAESEQCQLEALALVRAAGDPLHEATVLSYLSALELSQRRFEESRRYVEAAGRLHEAAGARWYELSGRLALAILDVLQGDTVGAAARFESCIETCREMGEMRLEGYAHHYLGLLALERRAYDEASRWLEQAESLLRAVGDRYHAIVTAARASEQAMRGRIDAAEELLAASSGALEGFHSPILARAVDAHRGVLEVARADRARRDGDMRRATSELGRARERYEELSAVESDEVALASRVLACALAEAEERARSWRVHPHGWWFQPPSRERVTLSRRPTLARVLAALVQKRYDQRGTVMAVDALAAAAWPGARLIPSSAANRVRVAVSTLRKLGLNDVLRRGCDGYLWDPTKPLEIASDGEAATRRDLVTVPSSR